MRVSSCQDVSGRVLRATIFVSDANSNPERTNTTMKAKLTDVGIRSYTPRAAQYSIGDAACPGLCIRITPKGIKTFAYAYRDKATGKVAWLTIGRYPDVPLAKAREVVNDARKTVANRRDAARAQDPARGS